MEAPKLPKVVFRNVRQKPRQFNFSKRFYDPEKEEKEKRRKEIEREVAMEKGEKVDYVPGGKVSFRAQRESKKAYRKGAASSNMRLIVILAILIILAYMAFEYIDKIGG